MIANQSSSTKVTHYGVPHVHHIYMNILITVEKCDSEFPLMKKYVYQTVCKYI